MYHHSRHLTLLIISLCCLLGIVLWKSPQAVVVTLAQPAYADSPTTAVQNFWRYLDSRQIEQVESLVLSREINPAGKHEIEIWEDLVETNPFWTLQRLEFIDVQPAQVVNVRVFWTTPLHEEHTAMYAIGTKKTEEGWRINDFKKVINVSQIGFVQNSYLK